MKEVIHEEAENRNYHYHTRTILTWPQGTVIFAQPCVPMVLMDFSVTAGIEWNKFFVIIAAGQTLISVQAANYWI